MNICSGVNVRGFLVPSISKNSGRMLFYNTRSIFSSLFVQFFKNVCIDVHIVQKRLTVSKTVTLDWLKQFCLYSAKYSTY
jgi:hypothetical protein